MDDLAVPQHHRSGAHRARRHPLLVALATVGAVAVASAVLLWGLLAFDVLGVGDDLLEAGAPVLPSLPATEPPATVPPSSQAPPPGPPPTVDRTLPLEVLNSTGIVGLAAGAAGELASAGWTIGAVGNYDGEEVGTTVLFPEQSQSATAQALVDELGVGSTLRSEDVDMLTVVLGRDYPG